LRRVDLPAPEGPETTMGRFSVLGERLLVGCIGSAVWRGSGGTIYLPVEDIVASWRVGMKGTGVRRTEEVECLEAFVKQ
jgi:hypothetical protein